jgi:BirA family biotin operon repressor/biotin-[acetyl-CoA-carboxylase] ligase
MRASKCVNANEKRSTILGTTVIHVKHAGSTMDLALHHARIIGKTVAVFADQQTAGCGTRDRGWRSPPGNVYLTVCYLTSSFTFGPSIPLLPFLIGNKLIAVIRRYIIDDSSLALKWSNDILVGDAKLSGTLIRSVDNGKWLVVGVGINVCNAPQVTDGGRVAAKLCDVGFQPTKLSSFITELIRALLSLSRAAKPHLPKALVKWRSSANMGATTFYDGADWCPIEVLPNGDLLAYDVKHQSICRELQSTNVIACREAHDSLSAKEEEKQQQTAETKKRKLS